MSRNLQECERAAQLFARMDPDPADVPSPDEIEWLAQHLERCTSCSLADAATGLLLASLRSLDDPSETPDEQVFAVRREAILAAIQAEAEPERGGAGAQREGRRSGDRAQRVGAAHPYGSARRWLPAVLAFAAGIALVVTVAGLRERQRLARDDAAVRRETPEVVAGLDVAELADADDAWVLASGEVMTIELPASGSRPFGELSDEELDEIEGVFVSVPGWS